jgi:hypothetical protein
MARVRKNKLLKGVSGRVGRVLVIKQVRGKTVMANMPSRRTKREHLKKQTPGAKANRARFRKATLYATACMKNPVTKALYVTGITEDKDCANRVAVSDFLNAPKIHFIRTFAYKGDVGGKIMIKATDDFMVTKVDVEIVTADGTTLEEGQAVRNARRAHMWRYTATKSNTKLVGTKIIVTAWDRPQNRTSAEVVISAPDSLPNKK